MLKTLYAKNYALIDEVQIAFTGGLNILTGETGAGKSILIDALGLILGTRASADTVRQGAGKAIVEGIFTLSDNDYVRQLLRDNDYDDGDELIVRREITTRGGSRSFVNDSPAQLSFVRDIGDHLVDLHGQHEHQLLLRQETHVGLLDSAGGLEHLVREFATRFARLAELERELDGTRRREQQLKDKVEFHQFQLSEIDDVDPQPDEDVALEQELRILENSERVAELASTLYSVLYDSEHSARDQMIRAGNLLEQLEHIDPGFGEYRSECHSASVIIQEIAHHLQRYSAGIDYSPERLELKRERLLKLNGLRKRFGGTLEATIEYRNRIAEEIELAENFDSTIRQMESAIDELRAQSGEAAAKLSKKRTEMARKIERAIERVLKTLGIEHGRFVIHVEPLEADGPGVGTVRNDGHWFQATATGIDRVEFFISTNLGEEPKPLVRVASGGEVSRVMLALKTVLAKHSRLPILVFDEIDTGISGRISTKVGATMRNLADFHQIIAITHLAQIAAQAHTHFVVEKSVQKTRTVTSVRRLTAEEHTREVARLMSGENITESSLKMARELIGS